MPHPELQAFVATRRQTLGLVTDLCQRQAAGTDFSGLLSFIASRECRHQDQIGNLLATPGFATDESRGLA